MSTFTSNLEGKLLDIISATTPWLAPLMPAYMAWYNMIHVLEWPPLLAFFGATTIEFLGLSTVHTTFQFWTYNEARQYRFQTALDSLTKNKRAKKAVRGASGLAKTRLTALAGGFYLTLVIVVNVILDLKSPPEQIIAKVLLSLISIVAAITLALRAQHKRQLAEVEQLRENRRVARVVSRKPNEPVIVAPQRAKDKVRDYLAGNPNMAHRPTELARLLGLSEGTVKSAIHRMEKVNNNDALIPSVIVS